MPMSTYPHSQALVQEPGNEDNVYLEEVDRDIESLFLEVEE